MKSFAERIASLTPKQRALLERKQKLKESAEAAAKQIPKREGEGPWPASKDQTAFWFIQQMSPNTIAYNVGSASRLVGPLDPDIMERTVNEIIRRHEILRTTFREVDGDIYQDVAPELFLPLNYIDMRHVPSVDREDEAARKVSSIIREPYDLEKGPLIRYALLRMAEEDHIQAVVLHHSITDWWSFQNLTYELNVIYQAFLHDQPSPVPELPIQFIEYAIWRNRWYESEECSSQGDYWHQKLAGGNFALEIPADHPRPPVMTHRGSRFFLKLSPKILSGVHRINRESNSSMLMTTISLAYAFFYRYTGETDIIIGSPVSNREQPEVEPLIGYMLNMLALRVDLSGDPTFKELLSRVRVVVLEAFEHNKYPFPALVENLNPERDLSRNAIYQVEFNSITVSGPDPRQVHDIEAKRDSGKPMFVEEPYNVDRQTASADLQISLIEGADFLEVWLEYATDLFERETIMRMADLLDRLSENLVAHPDVPISELPWLSRARVEDLRQFSRPQHEAPIRHETVCDHFEATAAAMPEAIAIDCDEERLTFAEVNERANQIAHYLRGQGIGPDTLVGVCLEPGLTLPTVLLGILKAGGAYVPLASDYPQDRLSFMISDTGMSALITDSTLIDALPAFEISFLNTLILDEDADLLEESSTENPEPLQTSDHLAYVVYTSGTTGNPKGVQVTHRNILRLVADTTYVSVEAGDGIAQVSNTSFDALTFEIWTSLLLGGRLCPVSKDTFIEPEAFAKALQDRNIVTLFITTALFNKFAHSIPTIFNHMKFVCFGGEQVDPESVRAILHAGGPQHLRHVYGPTESTTFATWYPLSHVPANVRNLPIGGPIAHTRVLVLDPKLQFSPIGVVGQLMIGGEGLARGYLNRPALTATRFLPNPHPQTTQGGERLYATGDLVRYLANGAVEFIGRNDFQVKVRGFRIELAEVEFHLRNHNLVSEAVAVVLSNNQREKRLVAYIQPTEPTDVAALIEEIRAYMSEHLPIYMVPGQFVVLDTLPLTANGKIDRKALPAPESIQVEDTYIAPQNELEETLATIWADVLGVEKVGVEDNFFQLGGDSILAIQLVTRARRVQLKVTPKEIFQYQTISQLALHCERESEGEVNRDLVNGSVALNPIQDWFFEQDLAQPHQFNIAFMLKVQEPVQVDQLEKALEVVIHHHDALRLRYALEDGQWQQWYVDMEEGPHLPVTHADLSREEDPLVSLAQHANQLQTSLDIHQGPLCRIQLFDMGEHRTQRLVIVFHHIAFDIVSWNLFADDLALALAQVERGETPDLGTKTASLQTWSQRLTQFGTSAAVYSQKAYWLDQVTSEAAILPIDNPDGHNLVATATVVSSILDCETTTQLLQDIPTVYNTRIDDLLMTALVLALGEMEQGYALRLNMESHGRETLPEDCDVSRTMGWFTAMYPLTLRIASEQGLGEAIKSIKEQLRAVPNGGLGYGLLRFGQNQDADDHFPASNAQLSFNYLGRLDQGASDQRFQIIDGDVGANYGPLNQRAHLIDIVSGVMDGSLSIDWHYSSDCLNRETVQQFADRYLVRLQEIIAHCLRPETGGRTPSDFPLANFDQLSLDQLLERYPRAIDFYPPTPLQLGLLFHSQMAATASIYSVQVVLKFKGEVNAQLFRQAWQSMTQRHTAMRTLFCETGPEPLQLVLAEASIDWIDHDWREQPAAERDESLARLIATDKAEPFDPANKPPTRFNFVLMDQRSSVLIWTLHHALFDGWSVPLLSDEAFQTYQALVDQNRLQLPPTRPFRAYLEWMADQDRDQSHQFWRKYLEGFKHPMVPPRKQDISQGEADMRPLKLPITDELHGELVNFARYHGLTLNTLVQGAWAILMARYGNVDDVIFGVTVSGRPPDLAEVDRIVGMFINTLPLRVNTEPGQRLLAWLRYLQERQMEMREHDYIPLVELQEWTEVPAGQPMFETMLVYENIPATEDPSDEGFQLADYETYNDSHYPLTLLVVPEPKFILELHFDACQIATEMAEAVLMGMQQLLQAFVLDANADIGQLTPISNEAQQQIETWNHTRCSLPQDQSISARFESMVAEQGSAIALILGDQQWTYTELNMRANRIAHWLMAQGLGHGDAVGLCLESGPFAIAAMIGILKAGGCYVPLDAAYPAERIEFMANDTEIYCLIGSRAHAQCLTGLSLSEERQLWQEEAESSLAACSGDNPPANGQNGDLAYIMYTSGSTDRPKGVAISHVSVLRLVLENPYIRFDSDQVFVQAASLAFDAATLEVWGSLLHGARLVLVPAGDTVAHLPNLLHEHGVTTLWLTSQLFNLMVDEHLEALAGLKFLLAGGDALSVQHVRQFIETYPQIQLINGYGPTENTTFTTTCPLNSTEASHHSVPIGKPIQNTQTFVTNHHLQLLGPGMRGELLIAGLGLAVGYWNRPRLTAEKFIPNPFAEADQSGSRLYRSGDLARYRDDGVLEFFGRSDFQVKVRGYRIELGEIEYQLRQLALVEDAVVMVRQPTQNDKQLVAYLQVGQASEQDHGQLENELRNELESRLPGYMVPSAFMFLAALPVTVNGKVDRRALPNVSSGATSGRPPETQSERALAAIWHEVLGVSEITVDTHFFAAGGHSLSAMRALARIRENIRPDLGIETLFSLPRLEELAAFLDKAVDQPVTQENPIVRRADMAELPLSFAQERLWFLDRMIPNPEVYNVPMAFRIQGSLNGDLFTKAFATLVDRHEALRTRFAGNQDQPHQIIVDHLEVRLHTHDLCQLEPDEAQSQAMASILKDAKTGFDLKEAPLWRLSLFTLPNEQGLLFINIHHIICDAWSLNQLFDELAQTYTALIEGRVPNLPDPGLQYADFAVWQRDHVRGDLLADQLAYWRDQLTAGPTFLDLPYDYRRPDIQTYRGANLPFQISKDLSDESRQLCAQLGVTPFALFLSVYAVLLARYANQNDLQIGTTVANRNHPQLEQMVGFFINSLVMRIRLQPDVSFNDMLKQVQATTLAAFNHQDVPFEQIVEHLQIERDPSRTPLFQAMISFINVGDPTETEMSLPGAVLLPHDLDSGIAKFDLTLVVMDQEHGFSGLFEYNTDLFKTETATRMFAHFELLLAALTREPERAVNSFSMVSEAQFQSLETWNQTHREYPVDSGIHELFEAVCAARPDMPALIGETETWTYAQLNQHANQMAHWLIAQGHQAGQPVGLARKSGMDTVAAMLAILKAGGYYVPLDPNYPEKRLAFMIEDTGVCYLIAEPAIASSFSLLDSDKILIPERDPGILADCPADDPQRASGSGQALAYVMYTSGSTSNPKGVVISHANVTRLVCNNPFVQMNEDEVFLQAASVAFDAATFEIWGSLLNGARLVLPPAGDIPSYLPTLLNERGVTTLWLTSQLFNLMVDDHLESLAGVRQILAGGDALSVNHVSRFMEHFPESKLFNGYGPTENTTFTTTCDLQQRGLTEFSAPIGSPIANTQIHVVDANLLPVAPGMRGELLIAGDGLAQGYWRRPGLTAERFIPNPFANEQQPGSRLYCSGDLVRHLPDGVLEFFGRADFQVKMRGFRIELGEIEYQLRRYPGVEDAVVLVRDRGDDDKLLVAYLQVKDSEIGDDPELPDYVRTFLGDHLPKYMVPNAFVVMTALPMTVNGKIDRKALPEPTTSEEAFRAPASTTETVIAGIWSQVLGRDQIGLDDHFFELGGHSLLATQVVSRIRQAFSIEVPLEKLFEHAELHSLASWVSEAVRANAGLAEPAIKVVPRVPAPSLSFAQERLWFFDRLNPGDSAYNMPIPLDIRGHFDPTIAEQCLTSLIARHESLRTSFPTERDQPVQRIAAPFDFSLEIESLDHVPEPEREATCQQLVMAETQHQFNLATGPLFRARLLRLNDQHHVLMLHCHHAISDGWSLRILFREFAALYRAEHSGTPVELPHLPIQYADFAVWQRAWLQGDVRNRHLSFWQEALTGSSPMLELPIDHPRPAQETYRGENHMFYLPEQLTQSVKELTRQEGMTPFMTTLAAFGVLLGRYADQDDFCIGSPIANRTRSAIEHTVGFFVNSLVLRIDQRGRPTFRDLLARVRKMTLGAYTHQDIPFEQLVQELQPERHLNRPPLFQVFFMMETLGIVREAENVTLPGATAAIRDFDNKVAKFELSLTIDANSDRWECILNYNADLFNQETIQEIGERYRLLLSQLAINPDQPISAASLLTADESAQIRQSWQVQTISDSGAGSLVQQFAQQVTATPDQTAVSFEGQELTFNQLDRRANRLAQALLVGGLHPDEPVGICMESSPDLVVAILATLKAGGCFLPLDPSYPVERTRYMLADSRARFVITASSDRLQLVNIQDADPSTSCPLDMRRLAILDDHCQALDLTTMSLTAFPEVAPQITIHLESAAYVTYTSGSTGKPKGVVGLHGNTMNRLRWMWRAYPFTDGEIACRHVSLNFVDSVWELFGPLFRGVPVAIIADEVRRDPARLVDDLQSLGVTRLVLVPSLLRAILNLEIDHATVLSRLQRVITSGETLPNDLVGLFNQRLPHSKLLNLYGSSEVAGDVTAYDVHEADQFGDRSVAIGSAIDGVRVYLTDSSGNLVPSGIPGEISIGGRALARGYLKRPALTADRFRPDPFADEAGARVYFTGDRARRREDNQHEFLGRSDHQIKLRGFRIELGEVEACMRGLDDVREAVVILRGDLVGGPHLVGYYVAAEDRQISNQQVEAALSSQLPAFMVPNYFMRLDSFPLTPNKKLDRNALPKPEARPGEHILIPARNAEEQALVQIWSEVLNVSPLGVRDHFFHLGGHSLSATQVVSRIRQVFGVELPLRSVFQNPTVEQLARLIHSALQNEQHGYDESLPSLVAAPREGHLPLSFAQKRFWFIHQLDEQGMAVNVPLPLRFEGHFDRHAFEQALSGLIARHESLRTRFSSEAGEPVQVILAAKPIAIHWEDLGELEVQARETRLQERITTEAKHIFDLNDWPLMRCTVFRCGPEEHVIMLVMHHIISDGWSLGVLLRELFALYREARGYQAADLPGLPLQYADFSVWQRSWFAGQGAKRQLAYWLDRLAGELPVLPTQHPRPKTPGFHGQAIDLSIDAELTKSLKEFCRDEHVTLFMALITAYKLTLAELSGGVDSLVGVPIANRTRAELEGLIGFFVNTLVLRTDLAGNPSYREAVQRVHQGALAAYANQDIPFEKLVEELNPDRSLGRSPLFQAMFVFQNMPDIRLELEDTTLSVLSFDVGIAVYDFSLNIGEVGDRLAGQLIFNTELFEEETAKKILAHYFDILRTMVSRGDDPIDSCTLFSPEERAEFISEAPAENRPIQVKEEPVWRQAAEVVRALSIGKPFSSFQVFVLDPHLYPVPVGIPGELCIGGPGLARGYIRRPVQTALQFVPHPHSLETGARLYRTGDLAVYAENGDIEFLGRIDHQIKIRGFRVELGEIETALSDHPLVAKAVVVARDEGGGDKRLAAYLRLIQGAAEDSTQQRQTLRTYLEQRLPEYMVPSALVFLEQFPLTPNGKVNLKALPAPDSSDFAGEKAYVAPRTPTEQVLTEIWSELLKLPRIGIHDHFFELGGHSMLVTRVVARLKDAFGLQLPIKDFFEHPVVEDLAQYIDYIKADHAPAPSLEEDTYEEEEIL